MALDVSDRIYVMDNRHKSVSWKPGGISGRQDVNEGIVRG